MTDFDPPPDGADQPGEPIGSVGEEAAKLFGALADWSRQQGNDLGAGVAQGLGGLAGHAATSAREINDHVATGSEECLYCPVCRTVHLVRQTTPEVRAHLTSAATSFLQAVVGVLATLPPPPGEGARPSGVERIDLEDDDWPTTEPPGDRP
ncbi:hypothetical protein [Nocardioides sp. R-C-SC26]|uniref:hypothetical protein n=1 Tax=Nocardioides sp. R-C-SC26 TaxID=2870414 RepID=UPI001E2CFFC1|nr:hypothetical protein [Nocardioides sp. R-C-SC26]